MAEATGSVALIGVDEGLRRLEPRVSDEQAATQRANLDEADKLLGRDSAPKFEPPTPEIAELLRQAPLHWMRHEAAIALLDDALETGDLRSFLRTPGGNLILLTSAEWAAYPFRHQTLISGVWRGSAGPAGLLEYDQFPVLLAEAAFQSWCERVAPKLKPLPPPPFELGTKPDNVSSTVWAVMIGIVAEANKNPDRYMTLVRQPQRFEVVNARLSETTFQFRTFQRAEAALGEYPDWKFKFSSKRRTNRKPKRAKRKPRKLQ